MIPFCDVHFDGVIPRLGQRQAQDALVKQREYGHDVARFRIQFDDSSLPQYAEGTPVTATWGWGGLPPGVFHGYVHHAVPLDSSERTKVLDVFCIAASTALKETSTRVYENATVADVVSAVAKRHRMASVITPVAGGLTYDVLPQLNRSDWEFLVWIAQQDGYSLTCDRTTLFLQPREIVPNAAVPFSLVRGTAVQRSAVYSFSQRDGLSPFNSHDLLKAVGIADDGTLVNVRDTPNPNDPVSRTTVRNVARPVVSTVDGQRQIAGQHGIDRFHIDAEAEVSGDTQVRPSRTVQILNASAASDGYWWAHAVDHHVTLTDYRMDLMLGRDSVPLTAPAAAPVSWSGRPQVSGAGPVTSVLQPTTVTVYARTDTAEAVEALEVDPFLGLQSASPVGLSPARALDAARRPRPSRVRGAAAGADATLAPPLTRYDGWRAESSGLVVQRGA